MILQIRVIPRAKSNRIQKLADGSLKVYVSAPAEDNKANKAAVEILSKQLGRKKNQIFIIHGEKSHNKTIEIR